MRIKTSVGGSDRDNDLAGVRAARAYLTWDRWIQRLTLGSQGFADGLFLGVASGRTLDRLDEEYYVRTGYYRTDAYNERGLFAWELEAIQAHFPQTARIVVIGAGSGREVLALRRCGHDAVGYEPNKALLQFGGELLARAGAEGTLRPMTRNCWPADTGPVDAVVIGWGVYHSIRGQRCRTALLRDIRSSVVDGAPVLLSYFTRRGDPLYQRTVARVAGPLRRLQRRPAIEVGDVLTPFFAHTFTDTEIAAEIEAAGMRVVAQGDDGYGWAVAVAGTGLTAQSERTRHER